MNVTHVGSVYYDAYDAFAADDSRMDNESRFNGDIGLEQCDLCLLSGRLNL